MLEWTHKALFMIALELQRNMWQSCSFHGDCCIYSFFISPIMLFASYFFFFF